MSGHSGQDRGVLCVSMGTLAPSARSLCRSSQKLTQISPKVKPRAGPRGADGLCGRAASGGLCRGCSWPCLQAGGHAEEQSDLSSAVCLQLLC